VLPVELAVWLVIVRQSSVGTSPRRLLALADMGGICDRLALVFPEKAGGSNLAYATLKKKPVPYAGQP
jgi:hypothetical protein